MIGVGTPTVAHHSEKKMVTEDGGAGTTQAGSADAVDWDAGWDSDEKDEPPTPNIASAAKVSGPADTETSQTNPAISEDEDDAADAWGWGDDDTTDEPVPDSKPVDVPERPTQAKTGSTTREVTLSEPYWISSIPTQVFDIVKVIYDDGAELTKPEYVCTPRVLVPG
jgi:centromere/kinetochore protein ZW10